MISREELESAQPAKLTARHRQRRTVRNPNDGRLKENRQRKAAAAEVQAAAERLAAAALTAALAEHGAAPSMKGYENMNNYSAGCLERIASALERIAAALEPKTTKQPRTVNGIQTETPTAADSLQQIRAQLEQMYTDP